MERRMTITEALVELKLLDRRIMKSDVQDWCIVQMRSAKKTMHGETVEEYEKETKARFQSVKDLTTYAQRQIADTLMRVPKIKTEL